MQSFYIDVNGFGVFPNLRSLLAPRTLLHVSCYNRSGLTAQYSASLTAVLWPRGMEDGIGYALQLNCLLFQKIFSFFFCLWLLIHGTSHVHIDGVIVNVLCFLLSVLNTCSFCLSFSKYLDNSVAGC